jgi:hypothetical protein
LSSGPTSACGRATMRCVIRSVYPVSYLATQGTILTCSVVLRIQNTQGVGCDFSFVASLCDLDSKTFRKLQLVCRVLEKDRKRCTDVMSPIRKFGAV